MSFLPSWRRGSSAPSAGARRAGRSRCRAPAAAPSRAMLLDEGQHALPRIVRRVGELLLLAVKEAVRRALVRHDLVLDVCGAQRVLEGTVVGGGDVLVRAGLQGEDRRLELRGPLRSAGDAVALARTAVEADRAGQPVTACGREPRAPAAEAGADGDDRPPAVRAP